MEITEKNIKKWSAIGARPTLGLALNDLATKNKKLMVLTADVSTSSGLERFKKLYSDQYLDVGIAEQNMACIATGLAKEGYQVVTTTFAPFQSMRCLEQIRVNQGYMKQPIVMIGLASGIYHSYLGNTHCCFEDGAILRAIPNIAVVTPADAAEIIKAVEAAIEFPNAVYIRLPEGKGLPIVYKKDFPFCIGKANVLREGTDIALLANGTMVSHALSSAVLLEKHGIACKVVDFHTIKPLDIDMLESLINYQYIATIEEHNVIGGLGSAVAEYMMQKSCKPQQFFFGVKDFYPHAGSYQAALQICGLMPEQIADIILQQTKGGL